MTFRASVGIILLSFLQYLVKNFAILKLLLSRLSFVILLNFKEAFVNFLNYLISTASYFRIRSYFHFGHHQLFFLSDSMWWLYSQNLICSSEAGFIGYGRVIWLRWILLGNIWYLLMAWNYLRLLMKPSNGHSEFLIVIKSNSNFLSSIFDVHRFLIGHIHLRGFKHLQIKNEDFLSFLL